MILTIKYSLADVSPAQSAVIYSRYIARVGKKMQKTLLQNKIIWQSLNLQLSLWRA